MSRRLARREGDWQAEVRAELDRFAHATEARELLHQREIRLVLDALHENGVLPILFKGTPFAYDLYESPGCRPRSDTDLLVRREDVEAVHRVMARRGYVEPLQCDGDVLFSQFALERTDEFGIRHAFDFHWKVSTQAVFAGVLSYAELASCVTPVASLGVHAVGAGPVHALLLACIHPVMHHRSDERLIWIFDIYLMASRLTHAEFEWFVELAITKKMAAVARHQLRLCQTTFNTTVSGFVMPRLASARG